MALFGIFNVNKPAGCTSRAVVDRIDRLVAPAKAGHAGTLDPLATGVLVICVGKATRLIDYVHQMPKQYRATFLLGRSSETDDVEGDVTELVDAPIPSREMLEATLPGFLGDIQQRPPAHSAIKIAGKRAYHLARAGKQVDIAPRTVTIHRLTIERYEYPELELDIECGSGTYVRSLGRDLAAALGTAAVMSALERTAVGRFHIRDAVAPDDLTPQTLSNHFQPALTAVAQLPRVQLTAEQVTDVRNGLWAPIPASGIQFGPATHGDDASHPHQEIAAVDAQGHLVAIVREKHPGQLWPILNFLP